MFEIHLYQFNKKLNSTKQPTGVGTVFDCQIKDVNSILTPTIELSFAANNVPLYNYAYVSEFKRYYYIEDITYTMGAWVLALRCDVLATYRSDIRYSSQYVARSSSAYDLTIADTMYLTKSMSATDEFKKNVYTNSQYGNNYVRVKRSSGSTGTEQFFNVPFTSGSFIVGIVGNNTAGVTYYAFSNNGFQEFINTAMTFTPSDMTDVSAGVGNAIFNPIQYITTVRWFPVGPFYTSTTKSIKIGGYSLPTLTYGGYAMGVDQIDRFYVPINLPKHPASSSKPFMNLSPFTELNLVFQPFGCIPLDTTKLLNVSSINCELVVDYCGGSCVLNVCREGSDVWNPSGLLYTVSMDYGVQLPISSLIMDWKAGLMVSGLSWLKSIVPNQPAASENPNAWSYLPEYARNRLAEGQNSNTEVLDKAMDLTASALGQISTVGAVGSFLSFMMDRPYVMAWFKTVVGEDVSRFGRPLYQTRALNTLTGFTICQNASIDFSSEYPTADEQAAVISFLNSGVYLE